MGIFQGKTISFMIRKTAFHTGEKGDVHEKSMPRAGKKPGKWFNHQAGPPGWNA